MRRATRWWLGGVVAVALGAATAVQAQVTHEELDRRIPVRIGGYLWTELYEPYEVNQAGYLRPVMRIERLALTFDKDGEWGGFHTELRGRQTEGDLETWLHEAYLYGRLGRSYIKAGDVEHRLGLADSSYFGTIADHDGLKNDPDYGISAEGTVPYGDHLTLFRALQYFISEDRHNRALNQSRGLYYRDAEVSGLHEQRGWLLRLQPTWTRGRLALSPGLTLSTQRLNEGTDNASGRHETTVWGGDLSVKTGQGVKSVRASVEVLGRNSSHWAHPSPFAGFSVPNTRYTQASAMLGSDAAHLRYTYSHKTYHQFTLPETQQQLGLRIPMGSTAALGAEYVVYQLGQAGRITTLERSLTVRASAGF